MPTPACLRQLGLQLISNVISNAANYEAPVLSKDTTTPAAGTAAGMVTPSAGWTMDGPPDDGDWTGMGVGGRTPPGRPQEALSPMRSGSFSMWQEAPIVRTSGWRSCLEPLP